MATLDVKNIAGTDTGNTQNGRVVVRAAKAGSAAQRKKTLQADGYYEFVIDDFDNGSGPVIKDRFDDPRYYSGDTSS